MRKKKKPLWERILEWISGAEFMILMIGISAADSPDLTIPVILILQSLAWLGLVVPRLDWDEDFREGGGGNT